MIDGWFEPELHKRYEVLGEYKGDRVENSKHGMQGICVGIRSNDFGMYWAELVPDEGDKFWVRTIHLKEAE